MQVGKYQLIRKLAVGGMAEVFLAKAEGPGGFEKTLVLKRILPHLVEDASFVEMFLGEARLVAGLNHPHIVQIFDFGEADGSYFLAMEYIDGPNLRRWERQAARQGRRLPPAICARVVAAAAEGLAFAHDFKDPATGRPLGLIHRDVSPDNILVSRQGAVKVVDFGIAKVAGQKHRTQTGIVKGKVAYMPPEQVTGEPLDRRVDVYALGIVLYELLTGQLPFKSDSELGLMKAIISNTPVPATHYRPDVPRALQSILATALAKDREDRYPDCRALQAELDRYVMSTGVSVGPYQIAQLVEQVVDGQAAPATPQTGPPLESVSAVTTVKKRKAEAQDTTVVLSRGSRKVLPLTVAGVALAVLSGGYLLFGRSPGAAPPRERPRMPSEWAAHLAEPSDTGPGARAKGPAVAPAEDALPPPTEATEAPAPPGTAQAGGGIAPEPTGDARPQVKGGLGTLEFRIRPYAIVYLDGKKVGETPFPPIDVPEGSYAVTAVNPKLGKKVTRSIEVKAGEANVFKLNWVEE